MRFRSLLRPTALAAAALLASLGGAATAVGGATIVVAGNEFTPADKGVVQGTLVTWKFQESGHTTTSNHGFWNSGVRASGSEYDKRMQSAGRFPYHCARHSQMKGSIGVPLEASGSPDSGWNLHWSSRAAGNGRAFDVQYRREGAPTWRSFRTNTSAATGLFDPAQSGTYRLRARTTNTDPTPDKESGWSRVISRKIS